MGLALGFDVEATGLVRGAEPVAEHEQTPRQATAAKVATVRWNAGIPVVRLISDFPPLSPLRTEPKAAASISRLERSGGPLRLDE